MNEIDKGNPPRPSDTPQEGNDVIVETGLKPVSTTHREYKRQVYQNLMAVVEYLESKSPLPASQRQMQVDLELSKNVVFDICWNLCDRGWAEDVGDGMIRRKTAGEGKDALVGKMLVKMVKDVYGIEFGG